MLRPVSIRIEDIDLSTLNETDREHVEADVLRAVMWLAVVNLRAGRIPSLQEAAVRCADNDGVESLAIATECVRRGRASIPEIVAWRVAELRQSGEDVDAQPYIQRNLDGSYYLKVLRSNSTFEDPVKDVRDREARS